MENRVDIQYAPRRKTHVKYRVPRWCCRAEEI